MFVPEHWVAAFINSLAAQGGEAEDGLRALEALTPWVKSLPGAVFGSSAAEKLETLVRAAIGRTATSAGVSGTSPSLEVALRFLVLLVKKNELSHVDVIIDEIRKYLDRKNGIVKATIEYALPPEGDELRITEAIKKWTGAARVDVTAQVRAELIGGYRLRIGDEVIDASVRSRLREMEACLASGDGGN